PGGIAQQVECREIRELQPVEEDQAGLDAAVGEEEAVVELGQMSRPRGHAIRRTGAHGWVLETVGDTAPARARAARAKLCDSRGAALSASRRRCPALAGLARAASAPCRPSARA